MKQTTPQHSSNVRFSRRPGTGTRCAILLTGIVLAGMLFCGFGRRAAAKQLLWISPGIKVAYTFGKPPDLHQLGAYLKLHLNTDGEFGGKGGFDDDDDWD